MQDDRELVTEPTEGSIGLGASEGGMEQDHPNDRRKFLERLGWGSLAGFLAINSLAFLRFFFRGCCLNPLRNSR
jgi:hypothetical protein